MENLFQEKPEEQRAQYLEDNCYKIEDNGTFTRPLTEEEINEAKNKLVSTSIEIREKDEVFKTIKKDHTKKMNSLKEVQAHCVRQVEFGKTTETGEIYLFDDQQGGVMESYDRYGRFISARPLNPSERQTSILTIKKAQ